jgi:PhnB protein
MIKAIPEGYHSVTPALVFKDARKAIDFYKKALGAREKSLMPGPNGKGVMHAELVIGDSILMLGEEGAGCPTQSAETSGNSSVSFYLYVKDADAAFEKAVTEGATSVMPLQDQFWGDRCGTVKDPFGYSWMIATHNRDLSKQEIAEGAEAFMAQASHK